eukprot:TRINITY_DN2916_c0_g2_i1.p1 TRINITY_DN2916_c0_g2~~TRINITY_DN2916_c0_g2_i1.p1  ORF type:complete len:123 (-),score=19.83 TRINITY_DN2916_c0_g2_i1:367-735(-)
MAAKMNNLQLAQQVLSLCNRKDESPQGLAVVAAGAGGAGLLAWVLLAPLVPFALVGGVIGGLGVILRETQLLERRKVLGSYLKGIDMLAHCRDEADVRAALSEPDVQNRCLCCLRWYFDCEQ